MAVWYDGTVISALERRGQVAGAPTQPRAELPFVDVTGAEVWRAIFNPLNTGSAASAAAVAGGTPGLDPAPAGTRVCYTTGWYSGAVDFGGLSVPSGAMRNTFVAKMQQSSTSGFVQWAQAFASPAPNEGLCVAPSPFCSPPGGGGAAASSIPMGAAAAAAGPVPPPGPPTCFPANTVCVGGYFSGETDFSPLISRIPVNAEDAYVAFVPSIGGAVADVLTFGGTGSDRVRGIAVDQRTSDIVVTGYYTGSDINFNPNGQFAGPIGGGGAGGTNLFVAKYRVILDQGFKVVLYWRYTFGTSGDDSGTAVALDAAGDVYVTGYKADVAGKGDLWIAKFAGNPSAYLHPQMLWEKNWSGTGDDKGFGVAIDGLDRPLFTGQFGLPRGEQPEGPTYCLDFDPSAATDTKCTAGGLDIFVSRFRPNGSYETGRTPSATTTTIRAPPSPSIRPRPHAWRMRGTSAPVLPPSGTPWISTRAQRGVFRSRASARMMPSRTVSSQRFPAPSVTRSAL